MLICSLVASAGSVVLGHMASERLNMRIMYYMLEDSNKLFGVILSISAFICFLNLNIKQSRVINTIAKATFGVLLIHANSDTMRHWLWYDLLKCDQYFSTQYYFIHAVLSVFVVYVACTLIELARQKAINVLFRNKN